MMVQGAVLTRLDNETPFARHRPLAVRELQLDAPGPGEVLVRLEAAGLCHSDLSRVNGDRVGVVPVVPGHEGCGRVVALGDGVTDVAIGDKVSFIFHPRCGSCSACVTEHWSLCPVGLSTSASGEMIRGGRRLHWHDEEVNHHVGISAFADHAVVDRRSVVVIPEKVPGPVGALLGCALLTGGGAVINAGQVWPGDEVAVVGMGGVGLAAAMVAAGRGATVTAIDPFAVKRDLAAAIGAHRTATPDAMASGDERFDLVVEAVGRPQALEAAIELTRIGGRTVTVGLPHPSAMISVSPARLVLEARSLVGSYLGSGDPIADVTEYAAMYLRGDLPVDKLISDYIRLDGLNDALDALAIGSVARQVVTFDT